MPAARSEASEGVAVVGLTLKVELPKAAPRWWRINCAQYTSATASGRCPSLAPSWFMSRGAQYYFVSLTSAIPTCHACQQPAMGSELLSAAKVQMCLSPPSR